MTANLNDAEDKIVDCVVTQANECIIVGVHDVTELRYHYPKGEGDRHYVDVYENGELVLRRFDIVSVGFEKEI